MKSLRARLFAATLLALALTLALTLVIGCFSWYYPARIIRAQVLSLSAKGWEEGRCVLAMRLKTDTSGAGRPEQVSRALGFGEHPLSIHRVRLVLAEGVVV